MRWQKLGQVFCPAGEHDWMVAYASNPVAEHRGGDEFRVYFSCRDRSNRSHIGYIDVELGAKVRPLRLAKEPVLAPGARGSFDDSGTSVGCVVPCGGRCFLFYVGWNLGVTVPWRNSIGLAIRESPQGPFIKCSAAPILDRSDADPYSLSYPSVLQANGRWRMWYGSNISWGPAGADLVHGIKEAESEDGVAWRRDGRLVLGPRLPEEIAVCRPWVVRDGDEYRMWFCHRGAAYRLGCATSADGQEWVRERDQPGPPLGPDEWDSEMMAYPSLINHRDRTFLFYNGNHYGKTGFGVAVADRAA